MMTAIPKTEPSAVVNGIAVDDVRTLLGYVAENSVAGMTRWRVASSWSGGMRSRAGVEGFEIGGMTVDRPFSIQVDEPLELGGSNLSPNPQEYLLAALNACMTVGFTALCALDGIEIETLEIASEGDIDLRGFLGLDAAVSPGYDALSVVVRVKGSASPAEFRRIFDAMLATSPNVHNITRPIALTPSLVVD
jgi:uncharacterized OsmC-like protein